MFSLVPFVDRQVKSCLLYFLLPKCCLFLWLPLVFEGVSVGAKHFWAEVSWASATKFQLALQLIVDLRAGTAEVHSRCARMFQVCPFKVQFDQHTVLQITCNLISVLCIFFSMCIWNKVSLKWCFVWKHDTHLLNWCCSKNTAGFNISMCKSTASCSLKENTFSLYKSRLDYHSWWWWWWWCT